MIKEFGNSGSSIQIALKALSAYDPASINFSLAEIDPTRVMLRAGRSLNDQILDYNLIAQNATNVVPISREDVQIRKKYISHLLRHSKPTPPQAARH